MALKVDVNQLLEVYQKIDISLENFNEVLERANSKHESLYHKVRARSTVDLGSLSSMTGYNFKATLFFITDTVKVLEEALRENVQQILSHEPRLSNEDYEHLIILDYSKKHKSDIEQAGLASLTGIPDTTDYKYLYDIVSYDGHYHYYDTTLVRYCEIIDFLDEFQSKTGYDFTTSFGLTEREVFKDFVSLYDKFNHLPGALCRMDMKNLYASLIEMFPSDFFNYGLSLDSFETMADHSDDYGDFTDYYFTYLINDKNVGFNSILSNDATGIEKLLCLFTDVQFIKTLNSLPDNYVNTIIGSPELGDGVFWINLDEFMYANESNGRSAAFYFTNNQLSIPLSYIIPPTSRREGNTIHNERYIRSVDDLRNIFIHELAHAFDDAICAGEDDYYHGFNLPLLTDPSSSWADLYNKFKDKLWNIQTNKSSGYQSFDELNEKTGLIEFWAEAVRAYFENPDGLKNLGDGSLFREVDAIVKAYGGN